MPQPKILGVSAGAGVPSRTTAVVTAAGKAVARAVGGSLELLELAQAASVLFSGTARERLVAEGEAIVRRVEAADILVVGSPVYRASYSGFFKHLFDLVDYRALAGRPVLLAATGRTPAHSLVIDHQFRPLFGFFGALTLPTGLYASAEDIVDGEIVSEALRERITQAAGEAASILRGDGAERRIAQSA